MTEIETVSVPGKQKRFKSAVPYLIALLFAALLGYVDIHSDDVPPSLILNTVPPFILAWAQPKRPWLWGLLIGVGVAVAHILAYYCGWKMNYRNDIKGSFAALVPALLAAYAGAWVKRQSSLPQ
jgi:CDP-diglyceride synthetase